MVMAERTVVAGVDGSEASARAAMWAADDAARQPASMQLVLAYRAAGLSLIHISEPTRPY